MSADEETWFVQKDGATCLVADYDVVKTHKRPFMFFARLKKIRISLSYWPTIGEAVAEADRHRTKT